MEADCLVDAVGASVVEQKELAVQKLPRDPQAPEGRRPPFLPVGVAVGTIVGEPGAEVVEQEVGVERDVSIRERFDLVLSGPHRRDVAGRAAGGCEEGLSPAALVRPLARGRGREHPHVLLDVVDLAPVHLGVGRAIGIRQSGRRERVHVLVG